MWNNKIDKLFTIITLLFPGLVCYAAECDKTHSDVTVCPGEEVTLTCETTDADSYLWSPGGETTSSIKINPTEETVYKCKATKKGGITDTDNLISEGDFEFPPSAPVTSAQNMLGDWINYEYTNWDKSGKNIGYGCTTSAKNANDVKTAYFANCSPQHGTWLMVCDGGQSSGNKVWQARNLKLKKGVTYEFHCYASNIDLEYAKHGSNTLAKIKFQIESDEGVKDITDWEYVGKIEGGDLGQWKFISGTYTPSKDLSWAHISIYNYCTASAGNDFAIDNIYFGNKTSTQDVITNECFPVKMKSGEVTVVRDKVERGKAYSGYGFTLTADETEGQNQITRVRAETGCKSTQLILNVYGKETIHACYSSTTTTIQSLTKGESYEWNYKGQGGSETTRYLAVKFVDALDYICKVTFADGSSSYDTITVIADAHPGKEVPQYREYCAGSIVPKIAATLNITPTDYSSQPDRYPWNPEFSYSKNGVFVSELTEEAIYNVEVPKKIGEKDTYVITIKNGTCEETATCEITAKACPPDPIHHDVSVCQSVGGYATLETQTVGIAYKWSDGSTAATLDVDISAAGTFNYSCTVTTSDIEGTEQVENFTVVVKPIKKTSLSGSVCEGRGFSKDGFTFSESETTVVGEIKKYRTETATQGCDSIITFTLTVLPNPVFSVTSERRKIEIVVESGVEPYSFQIDGGRVVTEKVITGAAVGWHKIVMTDANTCQSTDSVLVDIKPIKPMVFFTPNDDGINDLWLVENIEYYPEAIIQIFDRFSKLLHTYKASEFRGWDGMYNGHPMPFTDYWYYIQGDELEKAYSGHFILKR